MPFSAVGFEQFKQAMRELMSAPPGNYLLTTARDPKHVNRVLIELKRANKKYKVQPGAGGLGPSAA